MFAHAVKWSCADPDWLFNPAAARLRTLQLVLYAQHLASGHTLVSRALKATTVKKYISDIVKLMMNCSPVPRDFRYAQPGDTRFDPKLEAIFAEIQRYEAMPRKREPFTLHMLVLLEQWASPMPLDHLMSALADWFLVGLYAGNRLSEWAQPDASPHQDISQPQINIFSEPSAFRLGDFIFAIASPDGKSYRKVSAAEAVLAPPRAPTLHAHG